MDYLKIAKESCLEIIASLDGELFSKSDGKPRAETITKLERELESIDHEMRVIEEQRIKQIIAHPERESSNQSHIRCDDINGRTETRGVD